MIIDDYFASIERGLWQNVRIGTIEEPIFCLASDDYNGLLRCRVLFWDGSYLDVYEAVSTELVQLGISDHALNQRFNAQLPKCFALNRRVSG